MSGFREIVCTSTGDIDTTVPLPHCVSNSIKCNQCSQWIHGRCSGVSGKFQNAAGFRRKRCVDGQLFSEDVAKKEIMISLLNKLRCIDQFCYLGDLIGAGGGAEEAPREIIHSAWAKFRELAPVLTSRGASLKVKGKVYRVTSVLGYASEAWAMKC